MNTTRHARFCETEAKAKTRLFLQDLVRGVLKCFYLAFVESSVQLEVEVSFSFRQKNITCAGEGTLN